VSLWALRRFSTGSKLPPLVSTAPYSPLILSTACDPKIAPPKIVQKHIQTTSFSFGVLHQQLQTIVMQMRKSIKVINAT
jgi:hypothetical protein